MDILVKKKISSNIFSVELTVDAFGNEQLSEEEEREVVSNFPTKIAYRNLVFESNVKIDGNVVVVTDDETGDGVVSVKIPPLSNKEILVDENFNAIYKVDCSKITNAEKNDVLNTRELVAQAYCVVFANTVLNKVTEVMNELRSKAPSFEGNDIVRV